VRVLVVEDEAVTRGLLERGLREELFQVEGVADATTAESCALDGRFDAIILDVMLPDRDGFSVCRRLRTRGVDTPILLLTGRNGLADRVRGLDVGADDYLAKPFAFEELLARVEALGRRPKELRTPVLRVADLELDTATREVRRSGHPIELTPKEYTVLEYLMRHPGRVMSRTLITEYAWDYHFDPGTNIVDVVINRLRKKVDSGHAEKLVHTVRGVGYVVKG